MKTGILLSACMMVRNEERNLERCLKSIKKLVDEIVVVDTGSTDRTVEIAKHFGARIYHHNWANDFSLHRNQSISYARGKWVMVIDADEEFILANGATYGQVRDFLQKVENQYPAAALNLKDMQKGSAVMQFSTTRFFRKGLVEYFGIVHNQPKLKIDGQAAFCAGAHINHYGYDLTSEQKEAKFKRTSELLLYQVEKGELTEGFPYFYLCQLYADSRMPKEAVVWGEKYWENKANVSPDAFCDSIFFVMVKQYMKIGDSVKAKDWLMRGIDALPGDLDMALGALEYGVWVCDLDLQIQASKDFVACYHRYKTNPSLKENRFVYALRPEALAYAYLYQAVSEINDGTKAITNLTALLDTLPIQFREGIMQELEDRLSKSSLPIHIQKEENQNPGAVDQINKFVTATI